MSRYKAFQQETVKSSHPVRVGAVSYILKYLVFSLILNFKTGAAFN